MVFERLKRLVHAPEPEPRYVGAWAAYAREKPKPQRLKFYELHPPLTVKKRHKPDLSPLENVWTDEPSSLEYWADGESVRIVFGARREAQLELFRETYPGLRWVQMAQRLPAWVAGEPLVLFDFEQAHALPFLYFDTRQPGLANRLVASLTHRAFVQFVFASHGWTWFAEQAAMLMQTAIAEAHQAQHPAVLGSTLVKHGQRIADQYTRKGQSAPLILHARGFVHADDLDRCHLDAVFKSLRFEDDFDTVIDFVPQVPPRDVPKLFKWIETRSIPNPDVFLELHARGGFMRPWGKGREFVPCFCLTPGELPLFLGLPTDPDLPIAWTRPGLPRGIRRRGKKEIKLWGD